MSAVLVQSKLGGNNTGGPTAAPWTLTSSAVGFNSTTTAGNLLMCIIYGRLSSTTAGAGGGTLAAVTSGLTWVEATLNGWTTTPGTSAGSFRIMYAANAPSIVPATTTSVTHTISGTGFTATMSVEFALYEFSGIKTTSVIDATRALAQNTGTPGVGNITTSNTDLLVVVFSGNSANATAGSGFNLGVNMSVSTTGQMQYKPGVAPGANATAFTPGSQTNFAAGAAAFKEATVTATGTTYGFFFGD